MDDSMAQLASQLNTAIAFIEVRSAPTASDYFEAVLKRQDLERCVAILTEALGPACKAFGAPVALDRDVRKAVKAIGDVRADQSLFLFRRADTTAIFAMLWPWASDDSRITLKVGTLAIR